jgi:hypothetical protein
MNEAIKQQNSRKGWLSKLFFFKSKDASNDEPRPFYVTDEKVWLNSFQDLIIPRKDARKKFGNTIYTDQYVDCPDYDPKIKWNAKGEENKDFFNEDKKDELQLLLHSALTVIWQSPTGRHLVQTAIDKNVEFAFFAKEESKMGAYWQAETNKIGINAKNLRDVPSLVTDLIHELAHADQSHNKRQKDSITPSVHMKYSNAIEADARAHEMAVCMELAIGTPSFKTHHPLTSLLNKDPDWTIPVMQKLTQDETLTKDNIVEKAAQYSFDQYYQTNHLRTYYEDYKLETSRGEKIFATIAPILGFGIWAIASLGTRLINSGLKHRFQKAAFPGYLAKNMSLAGKPYMQDKIKEQDYSDPLYTGISHEGMNHLKQPGYWRFLDLLFIDQYQKPDSKSVETHASQQEFWEKMDKLGIMSKRESYQYAPQSEAWERSFDRYDKRIMVDRLNQQTLKKLSAG